MAIEHLISPDPVRHEIARLQWANALMRAANKALAKGGVQVAGVLDGRLQGGRHRNRHHSGGELGPGVGGDGRTIGATMHTQSLIRNVAMVAVIAALVASCASSSKVMLGPVHAPIDPAQVQVYSNVPVGAVEIAQLESISAAGFGTQGQTDAAVQRLKREAAKLGANGVVIVGVGSERSGGGFSIGGGSYGGRVGGGLGIGIPTTQKHAAGVAIWVPAEVQQHPAPEVPSGAR